MAVAQTYEPIQTYTVPSVTASVTLSSIPSTYTDIVVIGSNLLLNASGLSIFARVNGDTSGNYSSRILQGNGSTVNNGARSNNIQGLVTGGTFSGAGSSRPAYFVLHLMNYSDTNTKKTALYQYGLGSVEIEMGVDMWISTSAINSITFRNDGSASWAVGSMFTLYGIKAA